MQLLHTLPSLQAKRNVHVRPWNIFAHGQLLFFTCAPSHLYLLVSRGSAIAQYTHTHAHDNGRGCEWLRVYPHVYEIYKNQWNSRLSALEPFCLFVSHKISCATARYNSRNVKMNVVVVIITVDDAMAMAEFWARSTNERDSPRAHTHTQNIYILLYYSSHLEWLCLQNTRSNATHTHTHDDDDSSAGHGGRRGRCAIHNHKHSQ